MRKILSALLFFSLITGTFAALPLLAEEAGVQTTVSAPEPVNPGGTTAPAEGQVQGRDDMAVFERNAAHRPLVSAEALLRLLGGLPPGEVELFRQKHCGIITELVDALERAASAGRVSRGDYEGFTSRFAQFEIPTIQAMTDEGPSGRKMRAKKNPVVALVDARIAANSGDPQKADKAIAAASSSYPENPSVQTAAASYYNETKNYAKAEQTATDAIALDSRSPDAYKARALARASLEDRKGAIEDIKKAMAIDPQDESARLLSALLESRKAVPTLKSLSSVEEIKRALGASEDSPEVVNGAAGTADKTPGLSAAPAPDFARAKAYLKTAVSKNRLGDYEGAARYAGLAIEKDPGGLGAYLERANAYNFLGRYDDAVRDASFVIEKDPASLQAFNMRAWALNRKGQARDAETDASRAIGLNPNFADAWFNRALAYEKQGDYRRMLEDFKQAAALSGAYSSRYQDAVAQYGTRVPGFAGLPGAARTAAAAAGSGAPARSGRNPMRRFFITLFLTLTGGALVAMGLIHVVSSRSDGEAAPKARITHPDVLSPSVYYEGVATGKYKIERKLGEGAMGVVYEATDQSLGRKVAIKKMGDEIKVNEREKQRFLEEARTVALLHHPNIVEIYTIFEEDDNIYLVFEHVDGATLDRVLDKEARLPFERALEIFGQTAGALAYAHSKNVIHRDLKLSNIMLSSEGGIKVMDFGLARRALESAARSSNKEVVGSPAYMAPEQELGAASPESDIYSLGVCLYEGLTGVLPFQGPDFHHQKTHSSYQRICDILPGLPKGLDAVMAKCLAPAPEDRFHSAEEFRRALDATV